MALVDARLPWGVMHPTYAPLASVRATARPSGHNEIGRERMGKSIAWHAGRSLAWALPRVLRGDDTVVFGSQHPDDPDALVILDHLAENSARPLRWTAPQLPEASLLGEPARTSVTTAAEGSVGSLLAYARSRLVFHTSGLYASPPPPSRQTVVTVWHGDGPKSTSPPRIRGTYMVAGIERFGRRRIAVHGYPDRHLLVTGRPRVDDLFAGAANPYPHHILARLGLDERPIVWWLPTWRQDRQGRPLTMDAQIPTGMRKIECHSVFQFVVKPHPLTPTTQWPPCWHVITDADLRRESVRLYRLLGSAHAVFTDFSSVWGDFLGTTVPVAFAFDDESDYTAARGFYEPDWHTRLPGPVLSTARDVMTFVEQGWTSSQAQQRADLISVLGAVNSEGATERLFAALDSRGVAWR